MVIWLFLLALELYLLFFVRYVSQVFYNLSFGKIEQFCQSYSALQVSFTGQHQMILQRGGTADTDFKSHFSESSPGVIVLGAFFFSASLIPSGIEDVTFHYDLSHGVEI